MLHFCQLSDQSLLGLLHHRRNSSSNLQDHLRDQCQIENDSGAVSSEDPQQLVLEALTPVSGPGAFGDADSKKSSF